MIKKIKKYFELKRLYNYSKKILVINAASTLTSIKNIAEMAENFLKNQDDIDFKNIKDTMSEKLNNKDTQSNDI